MGRAPSHTAQALTPPPDWARRISLSSPSQLALAPVAMITALDNASWPPSPLTWKGRFERSTEATFWKTLNRPMFRSSSSPFFTPLSVTTRVSKRMACLKKSVIISGPVLPSG